MKKFNKPESEKCPYKDDRRRKLSEDDIININIKYNNGQDMFSLAEEFNVSYSTIRYWTNKDHRLNVRDKVNERKKYLRKVGLIDREYEREASRKSKQIHKGRVLRNASSYKKFKYKSEPEYRKKVSFYRDNWRQKVKDSGEKLYSHDYYLKNKNRILVNNRKSDKKNKDKRDESRRKYQRTEKYKAYKREYQRRPERKRYFRNYHQIKKKFVSQQESER